MCFAVLACSQPMLESYGCACMSRTYTTQEIAEYRALAARNDIEGLWEMRTYYQWRAWEHPTGDPDYVREMAESDAYLNRLIELGDVRAIKTRLESLYWDLNEEGAPLADRKRAYADAVSLLDEHRQIATTHTDIHDPDRPVVSMRTALDSSLEALKAEE